MAQDGHLDFHTAPELWTPVSDQMCFSFFQSRPCQSEFPASVSAVCAGHWTLKWLKSRLKIIKQWQLIDESLVVCCCYNCYFVFGAPLSPVCRAARAPGPPLRPLPPLASQAQPVASVCTVPVCVVHAESESVCVCVCVCARARVFLIILARDTSKLYQTKKTVLGDIY